jgi:hypothetical protein
MLSAMVREIVDRSSVEVQSLRPGFDREDSGLLAQKWLTKIHSLPERITFIEPPVDVSIEQAVHQALLSEQGLRICYGKSEKTFDVFPVGLAQQGVRSYLVAFEKGAVAPKTYLLARLKSAQVVPALGFTPADFDLERYLVRGIARPMGGFFDDSDYGKEITLRLWVDRGTQWLKETPLSLDQTCTPEDPEEEKGPYFLTATVKLTENLVWWILSMSWNVVVHEPETLRQRIAHDLRKAAEHYVE